MSLKLRDDAVLAFTAAADYTEKRGYSVTISGETATLSASATTIARGIILEGASTTEGILSVGILGAIAGTVPAKLGGVVTKGDRLQQHTDGTWITDATSGARVISLIALESGVAGDIIEAAPQTPQYIAA